MSLGNDQHENDTEHIGGQVPSDQHGEGDEGLSLIDALFQPPQPPAPQNPTPKQRKKWYKDRKFLLECLGFLVLSAYTVFSCLQWLQIRWTNRLTREALDKNNYALSQTLSKMDDQTRATNRLAVATETANNNVLEADRPWFGIILAAQDPLELGKTPSVTVQFLNSGKRPARVIISEVTGDWFSVFPKTPHYVFSASGLKSSDIVVPNGSVVSKLNLFNGHLGQADIDRATKGPLKLFLYANIEYVDLRTQSKHFTHSCWVYVGNDPVLAKGFYNSGDYDDAN